MLKLSIIVPFYNVEPYFQQCLQSLTDIDFMGQYEVLLIDDRGQDNSLAIAEIFFEKYPKLFKIITHDTNSGISAARNTGLDNVDSEYVMFVDSDDWISSGGIKYILKELEDKQPDLLFFDFSREYQAKSEAVVFDPQVKEPAFIDTNSCIFLEKLPVTTWAKVFKSSIAKHYRFPVDIIFEDVAVIPAVVMECKKILYTRVLSYKYRQRVGSIMDESRGEPDALFKAYSFLYDKCNTINSVYLEFITFKDLLINARVAYRCGDLNKSLLILSTGINWFDVNYPLWKRNRYINEKLGSKKRYLWFKSKLIINLLRFKFGKILFLSHLNNEKFSINKLINNFKKSESRVK